MTTRNVFAIILAAGNSTRMVGFNQPKQFLLLDEYCVLHHTLKPFFQCKQVSHLLIVTKPIWFEQTKKICKLLNQHCIRTPEDLKISLVNGGHDRNDSIVSALVSIKTMHEKCNQDIILTHDAARPFVSVDLIEQCIQATKKYGACSVISPAVDTVALANNNFFEQTLPRDKTYLVQTPQCFIFQHGIKMYDIAKTNSWPKSTDVSSLLLLKNFKVAVVHGYRENIKITTNTDYELAKLILENRRKQRIEQN